MYVKVVGKWVPCDFLHLGILSRVPRRTKQPYQPNLAVSGVEFRNTSKNINTLITTVSLSQQRVFDCANLVLCSGVQGKKYTKLLLACAALYSHVFSSINYKISVVDTMTLHYLRSILYYISVFLSCQFFFSCERNMITPVND